jgi:GPH family glycoside/pentoside/hexuronide:cation symporter
MNIETTKKKDFQQDIVPRSKKLFWSMGAFSDTYMANAVSYLAMPIYQVGLGLDPRWLGLAMGIPRLWDAFSDPLMGNISDNTKSKWGRRRPFIFLGAILSGLLFALLWFPPSFLGKTGLTVYFIVVCLLYYTAYTIYTVPWGALGLGLSTDYNERTRIMSYRTFFQALFAVGLGTLWWLSLKMGGADENAVIGIRKVGPVFGFLIIIAGIIPAVFCKEKVRTQKKISIYNAIKQTFTNKVYLLLLGIIFLIMLGLFLVQPFSLYVNINYVFGGKQEPVAKLNMIANVIFQLFGLGLVPLVSFIGTRFGKKKTLIGGLLFVITGYLSCWFTFTPQMPYLQLVSFALIAPGLSCAWVLTTSMIADICDLDELKTSMRREGMYGASFSWVCKMAIGGALLLTGYMLSFTGFETDVTIQSQNTIFLLRLLYVVVPASIITLAMVLTCFYPLTEKKVRAIRQELDLRKNNT